MAHIIMNYDVKPEKEGVKPRVMEIGLNMVPDPASKLLFRARRF